jgi:hypothetical protein
MMVTTIGALSPIGTEHGSARKQSPFEAIAPTARGAGLPTLSALERRRGAQAPARRRLSSDFTAFARLPRTVA